MDPASPAADDSVVWGIFFRIMGVMMIVAMAPLAIQIRALAGSRGVMPCAPSLCKLRREYGLWRSFLFFPSLIWLAPASDTLLVALPVASAAFGAAAAVGGWHAGPCLFAAWFCMLSTSSAHELPYPWDSLLLEASFLASLAPAPLSLLAGGGLAGPPPPPWLAFAFRLLVVRVLVGFGKLKFGESGPQDRTYIRSFLVGQPIPTPVGWWAHRLPPMLFEASLLVMWVVEMPLPFLAFFTGWPRLVAAAGIVSLMAGIQLTGNFGYFNALTCVICVPLLDTESALGLWDLVSPAAWWSPAQAPWQGLLCTTLLPILLLLSPFFFLFNSWCNRGWQFWPAVAAITHPNANPVFRLLLVCARALAPWRVVASYGVFYPHSSPPLKWALAFEGSNDGKTWKRYPYPYSPTGSRSAPPFVAPWHPRLDHDVFYKALGMNNANFSSNIGTAHPYTLANVTPSQLLCARLVEDDSTVRSLFHDPPFPAGSPPRYARASLRLLVPRASALRGENGMLETEEGPARGGLPPGVRAAEGVEDSDAWWLAWDVGVHSGPVARGGGQALWDRALPADVSLMHPEMLHWRDWHPALQRMHAMWGQYLHSKGGDDAPDAVMKRAGEVIAASSEVSAAAVADVFAGFVEPVAREAQATPSLRGPAGRLHRVWSWQACWRAADEWRAATASWPEERRRAVHVALGRLVELLTQQWRGSYSQQALHREKVRARLPGWFDAWVFAHALLLQGAETFAWALTHADEALTAMADAREAGELGLEAESGYGTLMLVSAAFWDVVMRWHWRSLRISGRVASHPLDANPNPVVPGFVRHMSILARMPAPPGVAVDPLPVCKYPAEAGGVWTVHLDEFDPAR